MKRAILLLFSASILLFSAPPASAQKFFPQTIQFKGAPEYSNKELLTAAGLKTGTSIAYSDVKNHSQRLLDTGLFESSTFTFNGVDLVFTLIPAHALYPLRLENLPLTPGNELDAALRQRLPLYRGKVPFEGGVTEEVRQALVEMLAAKGIKATVTATPYTDQKLYEVTAMSYTITAPPVRLGEISLLGVSTEMQAEVKVLADRTMKTSFDTANSAGNIERTFASLYADEGYANVKVHAERVGNPVAGSEAIDIPFNVTVEEGRQYKLGSIHLPSGELLTLAEINKAAGAGSNVVVSRSITEKQSIKGGVALRTALLYVARGYKTKGYMNCVVTPHPQFDETAGIVNYTLEVQPGPVYTMGKLTIQNTADDLRAALLAAWKMPAGAVFNQAAAIGYYATHDVNPALERTIAASNFIFAIHLDDETHTVDVTLRLERK